MDGHFLGGGVIDHVVSDGEIYLNAYGLASVLMFHGMNLGEVALEEDVEAALGAAHMLLDVADKLDELRSELLKREIEASFRL